MAFDKEKFLQSVLNDPAEEAAPPPLAPVLPRAKQNKSFVGDVGTALKAGVEQIPGMVTGLLDIPTKLITGRNLVSDGYDQLGEITGFQPGKWAKEAQGEYSQATQDSRAAVDAVWADENAPLLAKIGATMAEPRAAGVNIVQSLPAMVGGAGLARKIATKAAGTLSAGATEAEVAAHAARLDKAMPWALGAGEGAVTAGQTMDQLPDTADRTDALAALGAGVTTGAIGAAGSRAAQAIGLETAESALAGGMAHGAKAPQMGLVKRMAAGGTAESVLQEVPQSATEQMWQNYGEGKPLFDGVVRSAVEGGLAAFPMGAAANMAHRRDTLPNSNDSNESMAAKIDTMLKQPAHVFPQLPTDLAGPYNPGAQAEHDAKIASEIPVAPTLDQSGQGTLDLQGGQTNRAQMQAIDNLLRTEEGAQSVIDHFSSQPATQETAEIVRRAKQALHDHKLAAKSAFATAQPDLFGNVYPAHEPAPEVEHPDAPTNEYVPEQESMDLRTKQQWAKADRELAKMAESELDTKLAGLYEEAQRLGITDGLPEQIGTMRGDKSLSTDGRVALKLSHARRITQLVHERQRQLDQVAADRQMDLHGRRVEALNRKLNRVDERNASASPNEQLGLFSGPRENAYAQPQPTEAEPTDNTRNNRDGQGRLFDTRGVATPNARKFSQPATRQEADHAMQRQGQETAQEVTVPTEASASVAPTQETQNAVTQESQAPNAGVVQRAEPETQHAAPGGADARRSARSDGKNRADQNDGIRTKQEVEKAKRDAAKKGRPAKKVADMSDREFTSAMEQHEAAARKAWDEEQRASDSDPTFDQLSDAIKDEWTMAFIDSQVERTNDTGPSHIAEKLMERHARTKFNKNYTVVEDDIDGLDGWPAYSRVSDTVHSPTSAQRIMAAINSLVPNAHGFVRAVNDVSELPAHEQKLFADGRAAVFIPTFKGSGGRIVPAHAVIVANRINQGEERAVFLHEIGVHAAMPEAMVKRLSDRVRLWSKGEGHLLEEMLANRAIADVDALDAARVRSGKPKMSEALRRHEELAYFVHHAMVDGKLDIVHPQGVSDTLKQWLQNLVSALRQALRKLYLRPDDLTGHDVLDIAAGMAAQLGSGEVQANSMEAFGGEIPAYTRAQIDNDSAPMPRELARLAKEAMHSSAARKPLLAWLTQNGIVKFFANTDAPWAKKVRELVGLQQLQDGAINRLRVQSGVIDGAFSAFENDRKLKPFDGAPIDEYTKEPMDPVREVYSFMRDTSARRIDPRFALAASGDKLLAPLESQEYYQKAKAAEVAAQKALDSARAAKQKETSQLEQDLRDAKEWVSGVAKAHGQLEAHYASLKLASSAPGAINSAESYLHAYKEAAKRWEVFGKYKKADANGKMVSVVHDLYDRAERHLKSLGVKEMNARTVAMYELFYTPGLKDAQGNEVPRVSDVKAMKEQMSAGLLGEEAKNFNHVQDEAMNRMYQGPYFHAARYGEYYVRFKEPITGEVTREHYDNERDFRAAVTELQARQRAGEIQDLRHGKKAEEIERASASDAMLKNMIEKAELQIRADKTLPENEDAAEALIKARTDFIKATLMKAYIEQLPETSTRSMRLQRRNVQGASMEMRRSFNKRAEAAHVYIAMSEFQPRIRQAMVELESEVRALAGEFERKGTPGEDSLADLDTHLVARDVVDEIRKRHRDLAEQPDTPILDKLSRFNHAMYLVGAPSYLLSNMVQPFQFSSIIGARYGMVRAARTIAAQGKLAFGILREAAKVDFSNPHFEFSKHIKEAEAAADGKSSGITLEEWRMLDALNARGKLDVTLAREANALSHADREGRFSKGVRWVGAIGHYTEAYNRITTALAAYKLARDGNVKDGEVKNKLSPAEAIDYAIEMVDTTQLDYSGINRSRMMGKKGILGKVSPLVLAFQSYPLQVMEMHVKVFRQAFAADRAARRSALEQKMRMEDVSDSERAARLQEFDKKEGELEAEGKRQLAGLLTTTAVLAGTMGLPFATVLAALGNMGGDDDDIRHRYRRALDDMFGATLGGVMADGVPRVLIGADMQGQFGMQDMAPFSRFLADRRELKDKLPSLVSDSTGAFTGLAQNVALGLVEAADGNFTKAFEKAAPRGLSGLVKGLNLASDGEYRDSKGNPIGMSADAWDATLVGMGLRPTDKADHDAEQRYYKSMRYLQNKDVEELRTEYFRAREEMDRDAMQDIAMRLREFNAEHPYLKPHSIQSFEQAYRSHLKQMRVAQATGTGIMAPTNEIRAVQHFKTGQ